MTLCMLKQVSIQEKQTNHQEKYTINTEEFKEKLGSIDIEKQLKEQKLTVDQLWNNFKEKVLDIMNRSIPTKMVNNSKRKLPWINREMKSLTTKEINTLRK